MKSALRNFVFITLPALILFLIIFELLFRFVIPATQNPQNHFDETSLMFHYKPDQGKGTHTVGRFARQKGRWQINNYGWNSPVDYTTDKTRTRIAVIGDSYIDALQVDTDESYPSLLRNALGDSFEVYSFGLSGAPFSQYLHMCRYASGLFDPDILVFNIVTNDFDESIYRIKPNSYFLTLEINGGAISENQPKPDYSHSQYSSGKRLLKKSSLARYLIYNLNMKHTVQKIFKRKHEESFVENTDVKRIERNFEEIKAAADYILCRIREENAGRRILFVFDAPRHEIYSGEIDNTRLPGLRPLMKELCEKYKMDLLDMTGPMEADYREKGIKFNSKYDNHWNEYGHRIVCNEVLKWLASD